MRTDLLEKLSGALPPGRAGQETLLARLRAMPTGDACALVEGLLTALVDGEIDDEAWLAMSGAVPSELLGVARMRRLWDALVAPGFAPPSLLRSSDGTDAGAMRWAWLPRWVLSSQDEDLLLFKHVRPLLSAARSPHCPKRGYAIDIAMHAIRDHVWANLVSPLGEPASPPRVPPFAEAMEVLPAARALHHAPLVTYLERLVSYAQRAPVTAEGAHQRALDVHRCNPPLPEHLHLTSDAQRWVIEFTETPPSTIQTLVFIDRSTGEMQAEQKFFSTRA